MSEVDALRRQHADRGCHADKKEDCTMPHDSWMHNTDHLESDKEHIHGDAI